MTPANPFCPYQSAYSHFAPARVTPLIAITPQSQFLATSPIAPTAPSHAVTPPWCLPNTFLLQSRIQTFQQHCQALQISELSYYFPHDWSVRDSTIVMQSYHYFLGLIDLYPDRPLVPTPVLDYVWHLHILDTQRYRRDCLALFGHFIDHQPWGASSPLPGDGAGSPEETRQLLRYHFSLECCVGMEVIECASPGSMFWRSVACGRPLSS